MPEESPFDGMSFGQAVLFLKANPDLATDFDAKFKDEEDIDTLERARLHQVHSFYRGTVNGSIGLTALANAATNPQEAREVDQDPDTKFAQEAAAKRLSKGVHKEFVPLTQEGLVKEAREKYESVIGDLAKYDAMRPVESSLELGAAIGGAIVGGLPTIENLFPFGGPLTSRVMFGGGMRVAARIGEVGAQTAAINVATDPIVQGLSIYGSGIQREYDPIQTALAAPLGFVIGGGLAGAGEIVSRTLLKRTIRDLGNDDPQIVTFREKAEEPLNVVTEVPEVAERQISTQPLRGEPEPKPTYDRPPESVKSLQKMVDDLEEAFGVPIRQGRTTKTALGTYNFMSGIIHVKERADYSVSAHEMGHALDNIIGKDVKDLYGITYLKEIGPLDYGAHFNPATGQLVVRPFEGFAEFMRLFITNPAYAQHSAPGFYSEFTNLLERKHLPILEKLVDFQKAYKNYLDATPEQTVAAGIVTPRETWGDKIVKNLTDSKVAPTVRNVLSLSYDALVNKNEDWYRGTRAIAEHIKERQGKLVDILPSEDPRAHFEMLQRSGQTAMAQVLNGVTPFNQPRPQGPSIALALSSALGKPSLTGKWDTELFDKFAAYLKSRRGMHLWDKFKAGEIPNPPVVESQDYLLKVGTQYEKDFPQFRAAADMLHEYNVNLLTRMRDSGAFYKLTPEAYDRIVSSEPFYVPFQRDRSDIRTGGGEGGKIPDKGVYEFRGSMRDVINPIVSMINKTMAVERQIAHSNTVKAMRDFSQEAGFQGGRFVEDVPAHEVQKIEFDLESTLSRAMRDEGYGKDSARVAAEDIMSVYFGGDPVNGTAFKTIPISGKKEPIVLWADGGVLKAARFMTKEEGFGLYELLTTMPKPAADLGIQLLSAASSILTTGVTTHPAYALRNLFRDQFAAWAFIPGYRPFLSVASGIRHVIKDDEIAKMYRQYGGVSPGASIIPQIGDAVKADIDAVGKQGYSFRNLTSLQGLAELVSIAEQATRLGATEVVYKEKLRLGLSEYDAAIAAVRESNDLLDFGRYGSHMQKLRAITPFMNAWVQSLDKARRTMITPISRWLTDDVTFIQDKEDINRALTAWTKLGVTGFGLGSLWAAVNWEKEAYRNMGPAGKGGNVVIPIGDSQVFLLPKPWELSLGFTAGEYAYAKLMQNDPRAAQQFAEASWDALKPPIPVWSNPMVKTSAEIVMNYNTYTERPIVPDRLQKLEKEYQATSSTSAMAKRLGKVFGWSPMKVDYALSGYFGYWGKDLTLMGRGDEDADATSNLMDWTLLRAGIKDPAVLSDAREKFWKHMGQATGDFSKAVSTYNYLMSTPKTELQARQYFDALTSNRKAWVILHSSGTEDGRAVFSADDRRSHPLTRATDAIRELTKVRNEILENKLIDNETKKPIAATPDTRKKIASTVGQLALAEMVNALIMTHEPGYEGRQLFNIDIFITQLQAHSPGVANEIAARYATKKVYKTEGVVRAYDDMEKALIRSGSNADLSITTDLVKSYGYEFGAERRKQQPLRRAPIAP